MTRALGVVCLLSPVTASAVLNIRLVMQVSIVTCDRHSDCSYACINGNHLFHKRSALPSKHVCCLSRLKSDYIVCVRQFAADSAA
ncbi:hypothetical protein COO60DRAFT_732772 [Scenedesmus sp. NREL 46B-D3]|nr:hypothetical protein COO60DRAFT_732772 [Scenedesmus sp. NREL 46B-D3]